MRNEVHLNDFDLNWTPDQYKDAELQFYWKCGDLNKPCREPLMEVMRLFELRSLTTQADGTLTFGSVG